MLSTQHRQSVTIDCYIKSPEEIYRQRVRAPCWQVHLGGRVATARRSWPKGCCGVEIPARACLSRRLCAWAIAVTVVAGRCGVSLFLPNVAKFSGLPSVLGFARGCCWAGRFAVSAVWDGYDSSCACCRRRPGQRSLKETMSFEFTVLSG